VATAKSRPKPETDRPGSRPGGGPGPVVDGWPEGEDLTRTLLEGTPESLMLVDGRGVVRAANRIAAERLGRAVGEVVGRGLADLVAGSDPKGAGRAEIEAVLGSGRPQEFESVRQGKNYRWHLQPVRNRAGEVVGAAAFGCDVTEQRRAERFFRESEQALQALFNAVTEPMALLGRDLTIHAINRTAAERMGATPQELIGANLLDHQEPEVGRIRQFRVEEVFATGRPVEFVDGCSGQTYYNAFYPVFDDQGRVHRVAAFGRDVTDLRQTEQALQESEAHLRSLMHSARNFAVYRLVYDDTAPYGLRVVMVSPSIRDLMDVAEPMKLETWFDKVHPEDMARVVEANRRAFDTHSLDVSARYYHSAQGEWRWFQVVASGVTDHQGRVRFVNGILLDITEARQAEATLREKKRLLSEYAHKLEEVNTALQVLLDRRDEERRDFEQSMVTQVERLVAPYLRKLRTGLGDSDLATYLEIIQTNLAEIVSTPGGPLSAQLARLTPVEARVAALVRDGRTSMEIARVLDVSVNTVSFHRRNIRAKLDLRGRRDNLRSRLLSAD